MAPPSIENAVWGPMIMPGNSQCQASSDTVPSSHESHVSDREGLGSMWILATSWGFVPTLHTWHSNQFP